MEMRWAPDVHYGGVGLCTQKMFWNVTLKSVDIGAPWQSELSLMLADVRLSVFAGGIQKFPISLAKVIAFKYLRNPMLDSRVWATFTFLLLAYYYYYNQSHACLFMHQFV